MNNIPSNKEGDIVDILCDCGNEHQGVVVGSNAQSLEWFCPIEQESKFDVNA